MCSPIFNSVKLRLSMAQMIGFINVSFIASLWNQHHLYYNQCHYNHINVMKMSSWWQGPQGPIGGPGMMMELAHQVQQDMDSLGLVRPEHRPPNWRRRGGRQRAQFLDVFSSLFQ